MAPRKKKRGNERQYILAQATLLNHTAKVAIKDILQYRRKHNGIAYDEIFSLPLAFAYFITPRLELFKKETDGIKGEPGMTSREDLDKMILGFRKIIFGNASQETEHDEDVQTALSLFRDNIFNLWF